MSLYYTPWCYFNTHRDVVLIHTVMLLYYTPWCYYITLRRAIIGGGGGIIRTEQFPHLKSILRVEFIYLCTHSGLFIIIFVLAISRVSYQWLSPADHWMLCASHVFIQTSSSNALFIDILMSVALSVWFAMIARNTNLVMFILRFFDIRAMKSAHVRRSKSRVPVSPCGGDKCLYLPSFPDHFAVRLNNAIFSFINTSDAGEGLRKVHLFQHLRR